MAGLVPKRILDDIRFRSDIVEVISAALPLKRAGSSFKACCPFHKEKTPSFHVNPARQIFHCFGCGKGGDVFSFVMEHEGVDFMTAVRMLADRAGIAVEIEGDDGAARSHKDSLLTIHEEIGAFYQRCLEQTRGAQAARDVLKQRDLEGEAASRFALGYAPDRWDAAVQWAARHDVTPELMEEAGLVIPREPEDPSAGYYDRFRHRLMFPIRDIQGRTIGFSGRALRDEDHAKYLNSPETPLFRKSRVLYALDRARRSLVNTREAIICEGQIDVIRCHLAGFESAVAAQGTAFTDDHAALLRRYVDGVVLVFDSDTAGRNAAIKTAGVFMEAGLGVRVAALPTGEDPDTFIRNRGAEAFGEQLAQAGSAVDFQIDILAQQEDLRSDVGTMRAARAIVDLVRRSPNPVQQTRLLQRAAERLKLPVAALQAEMQQAAHRERHTVPARPESAPSPAAGATPPERALCEYLVNPDTAAWTVDLVERYLPLDLFKTPSCRRTAALAIRAVHEQTGIEQLVAAEDDHASGLQSFVAGLLMQPAKFQTSDLDPATPVQDFILRLWQQRLHRDQAALAARPDPDPDTLAQLAMDIKSLDTWDAGLDVIEVRMAVDEAD